MAKLNSKAKRFQGETLKIFTVPELRVGYICQRQEAT
jgi:hypothetical protein